MRIYINYYCQYSVKFLVLLIIHPAADILGPSAYRSMYMQNIEQLLDEVFVISGVIKVEVSVIS